MAYTAGDIVNNTHFSRMNTWKNNKHLIFFIKFGLALLFTTLAAKLSVHVARFYYSFAIFHYDSASYIYESLNYYDLLKQRGLIYALKSALLEKDSFDLILRLVFAPRQLIKLYGHMAVSLPLICVFFFLLIHYVYKRTQSLLSSLIASLFLFTFPFMFSPYMGIADFWKESIAVWILGNAILCFFLSDLLKNKYWSFFCGVFLGLLVMERSALSVYFAILFLPVFIVAVLKRFQQDKTKAFYQIFIFALPICILCGIVMFYQWSILYNYYFHTGYDYASPIYVAWILVKYSIDKIGYSVLAIPFLCIATYILAGKKTFDKNTWIALWFTITFPLLIVSAHTLYHGFYTIESIFLVILLAAFFPSYHHVKSRSSLFMQRLTPGIYKIILIAFLTNIFWGTFLQYQTSFNDAMTSAKIFFPWRSFFDKSIDIIMTQPKPRYFAFLFDEANSLIIEHLWFHKHQPRDDIINVGNVATHDTYYQSTLNELGLKITDDANQNLATTKAIAMNTIQNLEKRQKMIIFSYCSSNDVNNSSAYNKDAEKIAKPVARIQTEYFLNSPHWKVLSKIDTPRGCVYAYQYSVPELNKQEKWQALT